jgi:hypothetical protein
MVTTADLGTPDRRPDADGAQLVEAWLTEFAAGLCGPARARSAVVAELRDGLLELMDAHQHAGLVGVDAARAALREFGEPAEIAAAFVPELGARQARRTALTLIGTGPLVGVLWGAASTGSHLLAHATAPGPPWMWPQVPAALRVVLALLAAIVAVGVSAGLFAVAPGRWLPPSVRRARVIPTAAATLGLAALAADLILLGTLGVSAVVVPGRLVWAPVAAAGLASLTRLVLNARATRHLLATRAALA